MDALRQIPPVDVALASLPGLALIDIYGGHLVRDALREIMTQVRQDICAGSGYTLEGPADPSLWTRVATHLERKGRPNLRRVINATGIVVHTNLGRAPLAPAAIEAMQAVSTGYSNLEFDLEKGARGSRYTAVEDLICDLSGAEASLVVNNCAAAVVLALSAHAAGGEVVVSRGELVEIGGSFRIPDVITQSGACLAEVGTTNRTRIADYEQRSGPETRAWLKSHQSNFRIVGFTEAPNRRALATAAHAFGLPLIEDIGSGVLVDLAPIGLPGEPVVRDILAAGVDLAMFSGDKLLGGPQAGILVGTQEAIAPLKKHPLLRAIRIDKLSLAALEATLRLYRAPHDPFREIPVLARLSTDKEALGQRADALAARIEGLDGWDGEVVQSESFPGGGALPEHPQNSVAVAVSHAGLTATALTARLRGAATPVIGRISQGRLLLDLRTVAEDEADLIIDTLTGLAA